MYTKNKQHLFYFSLISFIFCSFVQFKRYKKIDESYVAKIGNSCAILAKNNFESNYFIDKNYLKEGELNRKQNLFPLLPATSALNLLQLRMVSSQMFDSVLKGDLS